MKSGSLMNRSDEQRDYGGLTNNIMAVAEMVLFPEDKSPYQLGDRPIRNFQELRENLSVLSEDEATWIADWLEYLGDRETASNIYEHPEDFRTIINERYLELYLAVSRVG